MVALSLCVLARALAPAASEAHHHHPQPLQLGRTGAVDGERGSAPSWQLLGAVEGTVLNLSLSCHWGRQLLCRGFVPLLGETCPGRLWCSVLFALLHLPAVTELFPWMLRPCTQPGLWPVPLVGRVATGDCPTGR